MKFKVLLKDPDALHDCIVNAVDKDITQTLGSLLDLSERNLLKESRVEKIQELCLEWFKFGEYLEVEIDTEAKTCTVQKM